MTALLPAAVAVVIVCGVMAPTVVGGPAGWWFCGACSAIAAVLLYHLADEEAER